MNKEKAIEILMSIKNDIIRQEKYSGQARDLKNRINAARWIRICSKHLPIVEDGEVQPDGRVPGRRFKVWRLME